MRALFTGRTVPIISLVLVVVAFVVLTTGCGRQEQAQARDIEEVEMEQASEQETEVARGEIVAVTEADFEAEVLQASVPVLVDFTADWCPPCHMLHPTLEKIAADYAGRAKVVQVDVDRASGLARQYGVRSIPTLLVIEDGKVVDQTIGLQPESQLKTMLDGAIG